MHVSFCDKEADAWPLFHKKALLQMSFDVSSSVTCCNSLFHQFHTSCLLVRASYCNDMDYRGKHSHCSYNTEQHSL